MNNLFFFYEKCDFSRNFSIFFGKNNFLEKVNFMRKNQFCRKKQFFRRKKFDFNILRKIFNFFD